MATPYFQVNSSNQTINQSSPSDLDFPVAKDASGTPVDISSGYTSYFIYNDPRKPAAYSNTTLAGTATLGAAGEINLTGTAAQNHGLPSGTFNLEVWLSNDAGTTKSKVVGGGRLSVIRNEGVS